MDGGRKAKCSACQETLRAGELRVQLTQHEKLRAYYRHLNCWVSDWEPGDKLDNRHAAAVAEQEYERFHAFCEKRKAQDELDNAEGV
eukprot:11603160-Prorocentrum_lima.AAC.1